MTSLIALRMDTIGLDDAIVTTVRTEERLKKVLECSSHHRNDRLPFLEERNDTRKR